MMKTSRFFAVTAFSAFGVLGTVAHADEADGSQFPEPSISTLSRAQVQAEAVTAAASRNPEPEGSRIAASTSSTVDRAVVRSQAAESVRLGQTMSGEESVM
ncbi:MAG: DUF4148 domain-containing protein [Burkholderiaceae bacterium]|nr:DUF4148 domain-containing protein [Burkholderiaceae bacterium]